MLRVLLLTPSFHPALIYGGPSRSLYALSRALGHAGAEVLVLTTDANGPDARLPLPDGPERQLSEHVRVRYCRRRLMTSASSELLARMLPAFRWADVIHLQALYSFPSIPALTLARTLAKPLVWSPRGAFARWPGVPRPRLKRLWRALCRAVAPAALTFHATSPHERDDILAAQPSARVAVVPNGITLPPEPAPKPLREGRDLQLLFMGRLAPIKGIERLLDCMRILSERALPCTLTIAGRGEAYYEATLRAHVRRLQLSQRVRFVGFVDGAAKRDCFTRADITVVPSHREAFSMVVAESLAAAVPVVASHGTPWQALQSRGCGRWVEGSAASLATAIAALSESPLHEMGQRGRAWMAADYRWSDIATRMLDVYRAC